MLDCRLKYIAAVVVFSSLSSVACSGQKMNVKIIQRQYSESDYTYIVPGHSNSTSHTNLNCNSDSTNVNCSGSTTTNGTNTASTEIPYHVIGATFSLLLPDGRVAVVNCESQSVSGWNTPDGRPGKRSCRMPLVDDIQVEFKGKNAKLFWLASIDGKKF